uniref:Kringle domain-containing protein n=1 Tax=Strongyloides stercoralis TaxID=6248 RepID=A0A0K0ENN1_STRER
MKGKTLFWILLNTILLILIFEATPAYYTYTKGNETLYDLYFDPSNHLEGDCVTREAQKYYSYFGRRNKNYQSTFLRQKCTVWENARVAFTNKVKFYKKSRKDSDKEKVKNLDLSKVEWGSSGYWKHSECRNVRLPKNHPYYKAKGVWDEDKEVKHKFERRNGNEKYRAGWNFGPWCYVQVNSPSLRGQLLRDKQDHSWYLNTTLNTDLYPMACFPICMGKGEKRISNFGLKKRKTNMIFNRRAINNINKHFFKSFHYGMMEYYQKTSDRLHASDDFMTFYKTSILDKYDEKLENGDVIEREIDDLDHFFEFQKDDNIEKAKEDLRSVLLKCQGIQIKRLTDLANNDN